MEWNDFVSNVQRWAAERGIYEHSSALAQLYKAISEHGELVDGVAKQEKAAIKDGSGDVAVCLINTVVLRGDATVLLGERRDIRPGRAILRVHIALGPSLDNLTALTDGSNDKALVAALVTSALGHLQAIAHNEGLKFYECLGAAWDAIKGRHGKVVPGGVFVKEGD